MARNGQTWKQRHRANMPYLTSEMQQILTRVEQATADTSLVQSIHFSPTALTFIRRLVLSGGTIITDTMLSLSSADTKLIEQLGLTITCFIDDPNVISAAEKKRVTRAEIAVEHAMNLPGMKLFVIGSAPMALNKLLTRNELLPMHDVAILAAPTGYASVVQLKERAWESTLPVVVTRGHKGGVQAAMHILHALLQEAGTINK
ncbi:MAG: precorrin-8X methylmutase [Clostridia bacterium]|nr:precorrin-8X methylmutase [Clostridia bacterium]MBQ4085755.1 precorrin-8X methylmutase [Clostridia bacterium]